MPTAIEWTEETWNPLRGCRRVSPGCENCYAERTAIRQAGVGRPYEGLVRSTPNGPRWTGAVRTVPNKLAEPLSWRTSRRVFVNSMSDLFHEDVPNEYIAAVFGVMAASPQHTFQILTKRADRMREWWRWLYREREGVRPFLYEQARRVVGSIMNRNKLAKVDRTWPLPNVWLGVSVEDQQRADERIPLLRQCEAAVHWVSAEPLLGPVDLSVHLWPMCGWWKPPHKSYEDAKANGGECGKRRQALIGADSRILRWVVVGGESGPGARPCDTAWVRSIVTQCAETGTSVFVKQLGTHPMHDLDPPHGARGRLNLRHRKGGDPAEWPDDLRVREYPPPRLIEEGTD